MGYITSTPGTKTRAVTGILPAVAAASGQNASTFVSSVDDPKTRRLIGVYSTFQTKFLRVQINVAGRLLLALDALQFSEVAGYYPVDCDFAPNQQFEYILNSLNPGGPAVIANTDEITFFYEVVPDVIPQ